MSHGAAQAWLSSAAWGSREVGGRAGNLPPCLAPALPAGQRQPHGCCSGGCRLREPGPRARRTPTLDLCSEHRIRLQVSIASQGDTPTLQPAPPLIMGQVLQASSQRPRPHPSTSVMHDSRTRLPLNILMLASVSKYPPNHMFAVDVASTPGCLPGRSPCAHFWVIFGPSPSCIPSRARRCGARVWHQGTPRGSRAPPTPHGQCPSWCGSLDGNSGHLSGHEAAVRGSFSHPVQRLSRLLHSAFTQPAFARGFVLGTLGTPPTWQPQSSVCSFLRQSRFPTALYLFLFL